MSLRCGARIRSHSTPSGSSSFTSSAASPAIAASTDSAAARTCAEARSRCSRASPEQVEERSRSFRKSGYFINRWMGLISIDSRLWPPVLSDARAQKATKAAEVRRQWPTVASALS